jgi:hypothetical protein
MSSRRLASLALLAAVLVLAGCGHPADTFVGTWRLGSDPPPWFVISKTGGTYRVTIVVPEGAKTFAAIRQGERLVHGAVGSKRRFVATYVPATEHLLFRWGIYQSALNLHRQSYSTTIPTPSP